MMTRLRGAVRLRSSERRERCFRDADLVLVALLEVGERLDPVVAHRKHQLERPEAEDLVSKEKRSIAGFDPSRRRSTIAGAKLTTRVNAAY